MRLKTLVLCSSSVAILALHRNAGAGPGRPCGSRPERRGADQSGRSGVDRRRRAGPRRRERRSSSPASGAASSRRRTSSAIRTRSSTRSSPRTSASCPTSRSPTPPPESPASRSSASAARPAAVLLRGLDRSFYTTTYNGREIFTAETRSVALQDFPAGGISAIEAFKTSTANLVEPGLSGLINVRSRRPFDFKGFEVAGSVWANYPNQSEDLEPQRAAADQQSLGRGRRRDRRPDQLLLHAAPLSGFDPPPRLLHRRPRRRPVARLAGNPLQPGRPLAPVDQRRPAVAAVARTSNSTSKACGRAIARTSPTTCGRSRCGAAPATRISSSTAPTSSAAPSTGRPPAARPTRPGASRARPSATTNTYQFAVGGSYDAGAAAHHRRPRPHQQHIRPSDRERRLRAQHQQFLGRLVHRHGPAATARPSRSAASIRPIRPSTIIAASSRII